MPDDVPLGYAGRATANARSLASAHVDALGTIACVFLALVTIGFAAFRFAPDALPTGASRNADRTFFSSVNAVTLTGFEQSFASVPNIPATGKLLLAALALGGAITTTAGGAYFLRTIVGADVRTRTIVLGAAAIVLAPAMLGALVSGYDGLFAATRLGLLSRYNVGGGELAWLAALAVPAVAGPTLWLARRDRLIADTLVVAAIVYGVATLLLAVTTGGRDALHALNAGSTLSVNASAGVGMDAAWPDRAGGATPWALVALMAIGTVPGGVGAGVGLLPLVILGRRAVGRAPIDAVESALLAPAIASVAAWVAIAFVTLLTLAATQPATPGDRLLFIVVSALANVGLSHDPIDLTRIALFVLSLAMLAGRLLSLATLCVMAIAASRAREHAQG